MIPEKQYKTVVSIAFGLIGFGLNLLDIRLFDITTFKITFLPGLIFPLLVSLNPPPWNSDITRNSVPVSWVPTVAVNHLVLGYVFLLVVHVLLRLKPVRRFFRLEYKPAESLSSVVMSST